MKIRLIAVGKTKARYLREGEEDFLARLRRYTSCEMISVKEEPVGKGASEKDIRKREAQRLAERTQPGAVVVILDRRGTPMSSEEFAQFLHRCLLGGRSAVDFIIGGPLGLPEDFLPHAALRLSLSQMTFTHEMTRLILLEQIYRALTILRGEKYHKGGADFP